MTLSNSSKTETGTETETRTTDASRERVVVTDPNFAAPARPIADFVTREDFPQCTLGEHLDIGGCEGVVVEIVNQSVKVKFPDGLTQGYNAVRLRRIYGPAPVPEFVQPQPGKSSPEKPEEPVIPKPRRVILEPDFSQPLTPITELARRNDFPGCAFGVHVDIAGLSGVVAEIVSGSLKVRTKEGRTKSFNAGVLRKLHGGG